MLDEAALRSPAEEVVRRIALSHLCQARHAERQLGDPDTPEALHDFRVAIRRLRSLLKAWHPLLGKATHRRDAKRLEALQQATNHSRDVEVALRWLDAEYPEAGRGEESAAANLSKRLAKEQRHAGLPPKPTRKRFREWAEDFEIRLAILQKDLRETRSSEDYAGALADAAELHMERLAERFSKIERASQHRKLHRARIAAKRLRYLLEPAATIREDARHCVRACEQLQDLLGELNDAFALDGMRREADESSERASELAVRLADRETRIFSTLKREWIGGEFDLLQSRVRALCGALRDASSG